MNLPAFIGIATSCAIFAFAINYVAADATATRQTGRYSPHIITIRVRAIPLLAALTITAIVSAICMPAHPHVTSARATTAVILGVFVGSAAVWSITLPTLIAHAREYTRQRREQRATTTSSNGTRIA